MDLIKVIKELTTSEELVISITNKNNLDDIARRVLKNVTITNHAAWDTHFRNNDSKNSKLIIIYRHDKSSYGMYTSSSELSKYRTGDFRDPISILDTDTLQKYSKKKLDL